MLAVCALVLQTQQALAVTLQLASTIHTTPFTGSSVSMSDHEGSAYVQADNSLWLADDNKDMVYEINPATGALKRTIAQSVFNNVSQFGGGPIAGTNRTEDFEAMAYDATSDHLYLFSGLCCTSSILPTVFRFARDGSGAFQPTSYQPLVTGSDYTGAAWNPADGKLYVGKGQQFRSYDYVSNTRSSTFSVGGVAGILGMDFSPADGDLYVVVATERLMRVDWATKTLEPGWDLDLTGFGVLDSRGVVVIGNQFFVSDGADGRTGPLKYAVFVFSVAGATQPPQASFTADPTSGDEDLTVNFTDTSTGTVTGRQWDFQTDGTIDSTVQNPTFTYTSPNTYTVTLTVTDGTNTSSASTTITVNPAVAPVAQFNASTTSGDSPLTVNFTDTSLNNPKTWAWVFGDGGTSAVRNPSHTYAAAGTYGVTLTVTNKAGSSTSAPTTITVNPPSNLVGNPGFETDLTGWSKMGSGSGVTLARVTTQFHTGVASAKLTNTSTTTKRCQLNDVPDWVTSTPGSSYTASIWVKGDVAGKKIKIQLKEFNGGSLVGSNIMAFTLSTSWQQISVTRAPTSATSSLDLLVFLPAAQAPPGTCFYADDASILAT